MRLLTTCLVTACLFIAAPGASAHDFCAQCAEPYGDAVRAYEIATLEQRLHRRFDHPARQRALRVEIEYAEARIAVLKRRLRDYGSINRFRTGSALLVSAENARLELMREEAYLRELRDRVVVEQRLHRYQKQIDSLRVREAQNRLAWHATVVPEGAATKIEVVSHAE